MRLKTLGPIINKRASPNFFTRPDITHQQKLYLRITLAPGQSFSML